MMEIKNSLKDNIGKIQHELVTAIQNHQVLVWRQQVSPSDSIRTQIEEVQRHIICLGESQKVLVSQLRNEVDPQGKHINNKHKTPHPRPHERFNHKDKNEDIGRALLVKNVQKRDRSLKPKVLVSQLRNEVDPQGKHINNKHKTPHPRPHERFNHKDKNEDIGRALLVKNVQKRDRSLITSTHHGDSKSPRERKVVLPKERQPSADSSSEENRTPCESPVEGNSENEKKGTKRVRAESPPCQTIKRSKTTLQVTPRPSSPVKALEVLSTSSEESLDSLISQQPETENKVEFALALGLITQEVYSKIMKKKSERRSRRRVSNQHHLYNDLWDLTVLQKRSRVKEPVDFVDYGSRDCGTPQSDSDSLCFVCRKPGTEEQTECQVCQTMTHVSCVTGNICPACTHQAPSSPLITEKKKELEQLRLSNKELHKSVSKLRERANELSASLVEQTNTVHQLVAKEERLHDSIKKLKNFVASVQNSPKPTS